MPRFSVTRSVEPAAAERLLVPRDDIVGEQADGGGRFTLDEGPFSHYERTVSVTHQDGRATVAQTFDFRMAPGTWPFLLNPAVRSALRRTPGPGRKLPWWYPPQRPDARGATVLGLLATLSLVVGYHGTLLTQTMTFAADEFGAGTGAQGNALAAVRLGGVLAIGLGTLADRRGRRMILTASLLACIGSTVLGAAAPSLPLLAATQTVNRGAWAAASVLLAVIAAEEMPAGARAYALSLLAMTGALGAGVALWLLPVADLGTRSWRLLYVVPLLFVPVVARFARLIPESRRFVRPHLTVPLAGHWSRLLLLAVTSFLLNVFMAPQSQFRNEFLRDERGFSAAAVTLFVLATSTPAGIGIVVGGRLADTRGRRLVGATGITVGTVLIALSFVVPGPGMWVSATLGAIFAAALVPTITVYGPELFPTSLRGRANGIVSMTAMGGSVVGLVAAGRLEMALGSFGRTLGVLAAAPLVMAALVVLWFPETARRELEDLNPEDRQASVSIPP
ncbi:MAG TPA: MFS transporter [Acidimicrobiales bacterium]|nr:MFS transporter [Acidimicrobiales bacterium]